MKTYIRLTFTSLTILAVIGFAASASQPQVNREIRLQKYSIEKALCKAVISWLSDANESAGVECDKLADSLLSLEEPGVRSYFIAAPIAWLRGKSEKAITVLEDAINKHRDEKAPTGIVLPVKIVARFWIATIAKQSGDTTKANNEYETTLTMLESNQKIQRLEDKGGLIMMCRLYLAEIESRHLKRNDKALLHLEVIRSIKKPTMQFGGGYNLYKDWAAYEHTVISKGKTQAIQELAGSREVLSAPLLALTQLTLSGIDGEPLAGSGKGMDIVTETLVSRTIERAVSPIDRGLARLGYGFDQQYKGNLEKAEKHYLALFEEDSFFSPVAGIYIAQCKKAQGKTAEADSILEQVRTKYRGYDSVVAEFKESWKKEPR
jgi:tetratricopeptide (TPR) repeat protein